MFRLIGVVTAASLLVGGGLAQTNEAPDQNWHWQAEFNLHGLKIKQSGATCTSTESLEKDLANLALGFDEACSIFGWNATENVTNFALACLGDQAVDMAGVLMVSDDTAHIDLVGDVRLPDADTLDVTAVITANMTGSCDGSIEEADAVLTSVSAEPADEALEAEPAIATLQEKPSAEAEQIAAALPPPPRLAAVDEAPAMDVAAEMDAPEMAISETVETEAAITDPEVAEAKIMPAALKGGLEPLPQAALIPEAPINTPMPVEDAS
jgi:hypothetical protein